MSALDHHFLLLFLFLLLAASRLSSLDNAVGILSSVVLSRKSSLDLREPLIEGGLSLPRDGLVLELVNHACSYHGLLPCLVELVYLSWHWIAMLCVLAKEDPRWLRLLARLDIQRGCLLRPLTENPWL